MTITRRQSLQMLLLAANGTLPGCAWMHTWRRPSDPFASTAPCVLQADATAVEVANHLNANTAQIRSWRAEHVKLVGHGKAQTPVAVSGTLVLEAPRNFRLVATALGMEEVDFGSNPEQFWFWNRRSEEKYVFVAYHDQESTRQNQQFPIPFQPEWIMETFGVIPIDAANVVNEPGPAGTRTIQLISQVDSPQGGALRKVTLVDMCHGIVTEQALYDERGQVATAKLSNYAYFAVPGSKKPVFLPRRYDLHWPKAGLGLTMEMSQIEVNPQRISERIWQRPVKEGFEVYELGR